MNLVTKNKKEIVKFIADTSVKVKSSDVVNEEEIQVLHMYRKLNIINKVSITSRIEGMLEAQMIARHRGV